ncbi:hypothetical protein DH2020_046895 [Rehmannia glutinosa]|uniref:Retrotransposon Copia-like N-terminal domain-containing protein n=1 Tax=Rehmannia glutinosa TaxID=99300 RepID=A0ABR0UA05_REHGL
MATDESSEQTTVPVTPPILPSSTFVQPQNQLVSIKLTESNYLLWKQQVLTAIVGYGLEGFISSQNTPPARLITSENTSQTSLNPDFVTWLRQDQLLASWLLSSLTENLLILMVGKNSSREIWETLEANFSGQSKARLMHHKLQLQTLRKGNLSMREFLSKVKSCCDALGTAGEPVSEQNHILYILGGLGSDYNPVVVAVTSRVEPYTLNEVYAMLFSLESRFDISSPYSVNTDGSTPVANLTTPFPNNPRTPSPNLPPTPQYRPPYQNQNFRGRGRGSTYKGRGGRERVSRSNPPTSFVVGLRQSSDGRRVQGDRVIFGSTNK